MLRSLGRNFGPRVVQVPAPCPSWAIPPCHSFLWAYFPTSCWCGLEFLWGKKVKDVDLYHMSLCSESWFFKNREVFLKLGTHIGSLATGVLEMMGRGYPFQIFTNLLLLKVNIVWCNNNNNNNDNTGKTKGDENCQAMQGEPEVNFSKKPWV